MTPEEVVRAFFEVLEAEGREAAAERYLDPDSIPPTGKTAGSRR